MSEIGFAIVGLGIGERGAQQVAETQGAQLCLVCDVLEAVAKEQARKWGCDWTADFAEVLSRNDVDVVGIYTPSGMHARMAAQALEAGKHVFTTKPLDITLERCDLAIQAAEKAKRILAVDFGSRWTTESHQVKRVLEEGWLGRVLLADLRGKWYRDQAYYESGSGWRKTLDLERGSLANQGVHYLDLLLWWLGDVEWVYGRATTVAHDIEVEDLTTSLLSFAVGAWGVIQTTTAAYPAQAAIVEILGDRGTLTWSNKEGVSVTCKEETPALGSLTLPSIPAHIIQDMMEALRDGRSPTVDGVTGRKSVELFEAIYQSSEEKAGIRLPLSR